LTQTTLSGNEGSIGLRELTDADMKKLQTETSNEICQGCMNSLRLPLTNDDR